MPIQTSRKIAAALKVLVFSAILLASVPLAVRIADPLTHLPATWKEGRGFPILVVNGETARIGYLHDSDNSASLRPGETYVIPVSQRAAIERQLSETDKRGWVLNVAASGPSRQRVELFILNDGYWGGAYLATSSTAEPLYWKITGPGYAIVFGGIATLIASGIWVAFSKGFKWVKRAQAKARAGPA